MHGSSDSRLPRGTDWIIVPNWGRFQHYGDRDPVWIKVYTKLLHDPNYIGLSLASQGLLQIIWLAYARQKERLRVDDVATLSRHRGSFGMQLVALNHAGFIHFSASKPLAPNKEEEEEKEKESPKPPYPEDAERQLRREALHLAADWHDRPSGEFGAAITELERRLHARLPVSVRERLWDEVLNRERTR